MKLLIIKFFPSLCHLMSLRSKYCLQLAVLKHITLCSPLNVMAMHGGNFTCLIDVCLVAVDVNHSWNATECHSVFHRRVMR
jgi:hypothetical protein